MPTAAGAIDLLTRTKEMLATSNLRLHKFVSNSKVVMNAFPVEDHAKGFKDLNLDIDPTPIQCSLGLSWDVKRDTFTFRVTDIKKPSTRRRILATVNSLFNPLVFVAPVVIEGKFLLREPQTKKKVYIYKRYNTEAVVQTKEKEYMTKRYKTDALLQTKKKEYMIKRKYLF
ncbi:hypothetical protein QTP86_007350 [Hemibagrus guttatus]|nr:hypothetical protein QTP86_007350 [Hemibagrus guttatus]